MAHADKHERAHAYTRTLTHAHTHTHACTHARTHTRTLTHARTHANTHARTHNHTHARTITRTRTNTHNHTHAHTQAHTHAGAGGVCGARPRLVEAWRSGRAAGRARRSVPVRSHWPVSTQSTPCASEYPVPHVSTQSTPAAAGRARRSVPVRSGPCVLRRRASYTQSPAAVVATRTLALIIRTLPAIIRTLTAIIRTLTAIIRTLTTIHRNLTTSIRTLTTIIRTLPAPVAGPSHAFVRARACRRAASCRAGSATSIGSTPAAARTRSHPSNGRRCGLGPRCSCRIRAGTGPTPATLWLSLERPCRIRFRGCAWQMCARDAPAMSAHAELEASFRNELAQLESQVDGLQKCAPPFRPHLRRIDRSARLLLQRALLLRQVQGVHAELARAARPAHELARGAGAPNPVRVQMWEGCAQSQRRCGRGAPSPSADVGGVGPVPVQMWEGCAQSRCRCGRGGPSPGADVGGGEPSTDPNSARALLRYRGARRCRLCRTPSACAGRAAE